MGVEKDPTQKAFGTLDIAAFEEACSSEEKCKELLGASTSYLSVDNDAVLPASSVQGPTVINGGDWLQIEGEVFTLDALIKANHLILSNGGKRGGAIMLRARKGQQPFYVKGTFDLRRYDMDLKCLNAGAYFRK